MVALTQPRRPLNSVRAWLSGVQDVGGGAEPDSEPQAARPAPAHLSSDQISPQKQEQATITYAQGGRFARIHIPTGRAHKPGVRGEITGFSPRARRALLAVVNSIDQGECEPGQFAFITLTYPREFPTAEASKKDLDSFIKRMEREHGHRWFIWKLEPQERGAPHYHLLQHVGANFDASEFAEWVARAWHEIAGAGDAWHLKWHRGLLGNRPCVEQVRDWQGVANYAGKYLGKVTTGCEEWQHPGRFWGQRRSELAPITLITHDVADREAVQLKRVCVRYFEKQKTGWYYIPGRKLLSGKHRAGKRMHGRQVVDGRPLREQLVEIADMLEVQIRPQRRRWRGCQGGGWSGFIAVGTFLRMVEWAKSAPVAFKVNRKQGACLAGDEGEFSYSKRGGNQWHGESKNRFPPSLIGEQRRPPPQAQTVNLMGASGSCSALIGGL